MSTCSTFIAVSGGAEKEVVDSGNVVPVALVPGACTEKQPKIENVGLLAQIN